MSSFEVEAGTPLGDAVARGQRAFTRRDVDAADAAYREAVGLVPLDRPTLWTALTIDHVSQLQASGRITPALDRNDQYLSAALARGMRTAGISLRLLRAEIRSSMGDQAGAGADLEEIRSARRPTDRSLSPDEMARLHRLEGLVAADQGRHREAEAHLDEAARLFRRQNNPAGVRSIAGDRLMIALWKGDPSAVSEVLATMEGAPRTASQRLLLAAALRNELRYEEAIRVLEEGSTVDLDPALHAMVTRELIVLHELIADGENAGRLLDKAGLSARGLAGTTLQDVRWLIAAGRLDEAERLLLALRSRSVAVRDIAIWHLAAGELELSRIDSLEYVDAFERSPASRETEASGTRTGTDGTGETEEPAPGGARYFASQAIGHLRRVVDHTSPTSLVEIRVRALRLLGRVFSQFGSPNPGHTAAAVWGEAHRLEEHIIARQLTDATRRRMLYAAPDEHDERIRAAGAQLHSVAAKLRADAEKTPEEVQTLRKLLAGATAAVVVAMEAPRGAAILSRILPADATVARDLPALNDLDGALRWVRRIAGSLPPSQAVWLMHSTPDEVHHALVGRGSLHHVSVRSKRRDLEDAADALAACWTTPNFLEASLKQVDRLLADLATRTGVEAVVKAIPAGVDRVAIVAGGALADIPVAAMTVPGEQRPIGLRFALSSLPCLSALRPLRQRSRHMRGDRQLLVRPPADDLTPALPVRRRTVLEGQDATPAALEAALRRCRHRHLRIDSHGTYKPGDPTRSWLQLAPDGPAGRLEAETLQWMDLRACGTLVLGACESGMSKRIGRDERIGLVRAAFHGGAASVVAARWVAEETAAATVLDAFDRYVRYLPRDVALQRALIDVCGGGTGDASAHPARWACWTLYGDAGLQTGAGPLLRAMRRRADERRGTHAAGR